MAWKETHVHDERVNFVREVEAGDESIAALCRVYGVSRKTGYKWWHATCLSSTPSIAVWAR